MAIDPLLADRPCRRPRPADAVGQICALGVILVAMALVIACGELFARAVFDNPAPASFGQAPSTALAGGRTLVSTTSPVDAGAATPQRYAPERCDWILPLLDRHGLPTWMVAVAHRESRCTAAALNDNSKTGDRSYGLFQINTIGRLWDEVSLRCNLQYRDELLDADTNVFCAAALYKAYGYRPWDSGRYFR